MGTTVDMSADSTDTSIATISSGQLRGYREKGVHIFKGVPYAADTGGVARWLPPRPARPWQGVRDALDYGAMCPQVFGAPLAEETAVLQRGPMSEDCLNLNIWTPGLDAAARPVMVWFHGGVFSVGSGGSLSNDGANLAGGNDVVVVTVNHRLNLFGFFDVSSVGGSSYAISGNVGLLDCVAALEWVRDNIAQMGGDPGNVTIFGQSGGGIKVMHLMAMPTAKGLFHRAIAQSGFGLKGHPREQVAAISQGVIDSFDLHAEPLAALQALPAEQLVAVIEQQPHLMFVLGPFIDGETLPRDPFSPDAPALSADVPMLLGTTETEIVFLPFAPLDPIDEPTLHASLREYTGLGEDDLAGLIATYRGEYPLHDNTYLYQVLASDWLLGADGVSTAERKAAQRGAPAWVYYWTRHTNAREGKLRAPHTIEIPYVFDTIDRQPPIVGTTGPADHALAERLSRTWATFARTGNPNDGSLPDWPPYDLETRPVLVIGEELEVVSDPHPATRGAMSQAKAIFG